MNKLKCRIKIWFISKRIQNLNFSELSTIVIGILIAISAAYPQFESINTSKKTVSIEFRSDSGESTVGDIIIENENNRTLLWISLVAVILGPFALIWKFLAETRNIDSFYNKLYNNFRDEFEELLKEKENGISSKLEMISKIFIDIDAKNDIQKKDLVKLKEKIYATQQTLKIMRAEK